MNALFVTTCNQHRIFALLYYRKLPPNHSLTCFLLYLWNVGKKIDMKVYFTSLASSLYTETWETPIGSGRYTKILPFQILACYLNIWRGVQNSDSVHLLSIKLVAAIIFARRMLSLYCAAPHFETLFVNNRVHHRLISGLSALVGAPSSNAWLCLSLILAWGVQVYLCLILAFKEFKYVVGKLLPVRLLEEVAPTLHNLQVLWLIKSNEFQLLLPIELERQKVTN